MRLHACQSPFSKFLYTTVNLRTPYALPEGEEGGSVCMDRGLYAAYSPRWGLLVLDQADSQRLNESLSFFLDR